MRCAVCDKNTREQARKFPLLLKQASQRLEAMSIAITLKNELMAHPTCLVWLMRVIKRKEKRRGKV